MERRRGRSRSRSRSPARPSAAGDWRVSDAAGFYGSVVGNVLRAEPGCARVSCHLAESLNCQPSSRTASCQSRLDDLFDRGVITKSDVDEVTIADIAGTLEEVGKSVRQLGQGCANVSCSPRS